MRISNGDVNAWIRLEPLAREFYARPATEVAPDLLGKLLIRRNGEIVMGGVILEAEAYMGEEDLGCHAHVGKTPRTAVMYGPPGMAYVYFTYGMHWMLNAVTDEEGHPAAVLIRAIFPLLGTAQMVLNRSIPVQRKGRSLDRGWTDGPAKLCQALRIDRELNGKDLCATTDGLWVSDMDIRFDPSTVDVTPRIGMNSVPEPWFSIPWRWVVKPEERLKL